MRILIVAATQAEIPSCLQQPSSLKNNFDTLVSGVGMSLTALNLGARLSTRSYDGIINVGIAGAFDYNIALGQPVRIIQDRFGDLGAEDREAFIPIDRLGFGTSRFYEHPFCAENKALHALQKVSGTTVNTTHGHAPSIESFLKRGSVQVESMEGAAVFQAADIFNLPCLQVRTISNYVETRNREKWDIPLALTRLNAWFETFCENMTQE